MLIFATTNDNKLKEVKEVIPKVISLSELDLFVDIVEDGATYEENAMKKAETILKLTNKPTIADDSGIEIEFFDNGPGIDTAYFLMGNDRYYERNEKILELMKNATNRKAKFISILALAMPSGERIYAKGCVDGLVADAQKGTYGHAYDSIFYVEKYCKTFGEMELNFKNRISHRGLALKKMRQIVEELGL